MNRQERERLEKVKAYDNQTTGLAGAITPMNEIDRLQHDKANLLQRIMDLESELLDLYRRVHAQDRPSVSY